MKTTIWPLGSLFTAFTMSAGQCVVNNQSTPSELVCLYADAPTDADMFTSDHSILLGGRTP